MKQKYEYYCTSKGSTLNGSGETTKRLDNPDLARQIILQCAEMSVAFNIPWDPFEVLLLVQAQNESKHNDNT